VEQASRLLIYASRGNPFWNRKHFKAHHPGNGNHCASRQCFVLIKLPRTRAEVGEDADFNRRDASYTFLLRRKISLPVAAFLKIIFERKITRA